MNICFVSNYLNNHVLNLCEAFCNHSEVDQFWFVELDQMDESRKKMGFCDIALNKPWVLPAYRDEQEYQRAMKIAVDADVTIVSHAPNFVVDERMKKNKLTFRCTERFYRAGLWRRFVPSSYKKKKRDILRYKEKNFYYLCMGAYLPFDLNLIGFPIEKCYQWAYFPKIVETNLAEIAVKQNFQNKLTICWAARMIPVKHPERAIAIAHKLKSKQIPFQLTMVGAGPLLERTKRLVQHYNLQNEVELLGNCVPEQTQEIMKRSQVFLFTSDYFEGWGAVLNESMGVGCVPVASIKAGASPTLIEEEKNGYLFETVDQAVKALQELWETKPLQKSLMKNAYQTIASEWNASVAVGRFVTVAKALLAEETPASYPKGPMAKAVIRKPKNYFYTDF